MQIPSSVILPLSVLAIFGAGCASSSTQIMPYATSSGDQYTNTVQPPSNPSQIQPDASASSSTLPPTSVTSPSSLAFPGVLPEAETVNKQVRLQTTKGEIVFELLPQEGPKTASNFVYLTKQKFYDGLTFHRVVPGFVIQGGDPRGDGTGGPGYQFEDDVVRLPYAEGIVAMANAGPNTNGSQFFIMLADNPLPPSYSIFGRVVKGMDVVKNIEVGDKMTHVTLEDKK